MFQRVLIALLFLSASGCSKKDDPGTGTSTNTGSYVLDGTRFSCQAKAYVSTSNSGGISRNLLEVVLTTTPQPASGAENLHFYFNKLTTQPNTAYLLNSLYFYTKGDMVNGYAFSTSSTTLTPTSSGGFSGTFTAQATSTSTPPSPYSAITAGAFTTDQP